MLIFSLKCTLNSSSSNLWFSPTCICFLGKESPFRLSLRLLSNPNCDGGTCQHPHNMPYLTQEAALTMSEHRLAAKDPGSWMGFYSLSCSLCASGTILWISKGLGFADVSLNHMSNSNTDVAYSIVPSGHNRQPISWILKKEPMCTTEPGDIRGSFLYVLC